MKTKNPDQLKAFIKAEASKEGIAADIAMQHYMMERLLERVSASRYRTNFTPKGGFLISAMIGRNARSTSDMDMSAEGIDMTHKNLRSIFNEITAVQVNDGISFEIIGVSDIMKTAEDPGIRISFKANYPPTCVYLTTDIATNAVITPGRIEFAYPLMLEDRTVSVFAYNLETILAEKLIAVFSRGAGSTRLRDYYDLYTLPSIYEIDAPTLRLALERTAGKRGDLHILKDYPETMEAIRASEDLRRLWTNYGEKHPYAKDIPFEDACDAVQMIMDCITERTEFRQPHYLHDQKIVWLSERTIGDDGARPSGPRLAETPRSGA